MIASAQLKNMALRQNSDQELCEAHATQEITSLVTAIDEYDTERNEQIAAMPADHFPFLMKRVLSGLTFVVTAALINDRIPSNNNASHYGSHSLYPYSSWPVSPLYAN